MTMYWYYVVRTGGGARWCASSHALGLGIRRRAHPRLHSMVCDD